MNGRVDATYARGAAPLVLLATLKLKGFVRGQLRRLRTPTGVLFAFVGLGLAASWIASLALGQWAAMAGGRDDVSPELVRAALVLFTLVSVFAQLGQRGLYLQPAELDMLLSAPVSRARLFGHRLACGLSRAIVGALLLGAAGAFRLPTATGAFLGATCLTIGITLLGQTVSLGAAQLEHRLPGAVVGLLGKLAALVVVGALFVLFAAPIDLIQLDDPLALTREPWFRALALPFEPLAGVLLAPSASDALVRGLPLLGLLAVAFELLRRWPFDWREIAVATTSRMGARLDRARRLGTGASSTGVSRWAARRRVPWLFGRGPVGAVFWRKSASILRRARVTLLFAGLTLTVGVGALLSVTGQLGGEDLTASNVGWAPLFLVVFGSVYLSAGLRFDLREEVDRIGELKAWPLSSRGLFAALLLPQVAVVGSFLGLGCAVFAVLGDLPLAPVLACLVFLPAFLIGWVATDNLFFLLWPVRVVPGADGALQDVGRASVLFLCRGLVASVALALAGGGGALAWWLTPGPDDALARLVAGAAVAVAVTSGWGALALTLGGRVLARFDPSRLEA